MRNAFLEGAPAKVEPGQNDDQHKQQPGNQGTGLDQLARLLLQRRALRRFMQGLADLAAFGCRANLVNQDDSLPLNGQRA